LQSRNLECRDTARKVERSKANTKPPNYGEEADTLIGEKSWLWRRIGVYREVHKSAAVGGGAEVGDANPHLAERFTAVVLPD
jgi:hypothetical protein